MLNIHELERRWIKYKIKRILPFALSVFSLISAVIIVVFYMPVSNIKDITTEKIPQTQAIVKKERIEPLQKKEKINEHVPIAITVPQNTQTQSNVGNKEPSLVLKPSLRFMDNIEDGLSSYVQDQYHMPQNQPIHNYALEYQSNQILVEQPDDVSQVEETGLTLSVTSKKSDEDLKDVIRRFKKNKNPALSLFIAKHYYKAGEYQKSYNYALMTNEIDKTIEESWIIFSKSLVKLGQNELAMNTLKSYLKTNKSSAAEVLLRKIESGSFK